ISETDFERIHQQSKAAALECLEKSSIRNKENFANTLNTAIKQEHEKALEVLKTVRLVTPNTVAKQQAIKPKHSFKFGEIIVQVANCGITDLPKSNIIVNSVGSDFILARGQVSRILLHHVGPKLQTECKNNPKFATESYRITLEKSDTLGAITVVMPVLGLGKNLLNPITVCLHLCMKNHFLVPNQPLKIQTLFLGDKEVPVARCVFSSIHLVMIKSHPFLTKWVKIERIQNLSLYKQYEGKREAMVDKVQNSVVEQELFHGTSEESSNKIQNN
uniref:PARP catalytic domain-containing protein n=1 Tax=Ciona intestinalis TaxID=7719 RepID=H2XQH2_CIOIN